MGAAEDLSLDPEDLGEAEGVSDAPAPTSTQYPFTPGICKADSAISSVSCL